MNNHRKQQSTDPTLARSLGIPEVTLLGIGALLGGGVFTLLGTVSGIAGGGLVFAMLLGAGIAFINLNAYVALATTFPQAGGGYHWVREGLGDLSGFLSGWCSWMASAVACALYAVSFGFFLEEFLFDFLALPSALFTYDTWATLFTVGVILLFGLINYRGVQLSGKVGGGIAVIILAILFLYIVSGLKSMIGNTALAVHNFTPLLPMGLAGVIQAAGLFYIAFEGSEIQAQTGEEVENPARVLKIGLFSSWAVVSIIYVLIAIVITGATAGSAGEPSWQFLGTVHERAIIESAEQFMPFGYIIMLVAGLLANLAALNATIYSSSRVLFSLGRDKLVFAGLGVMHPVNYIPARALIASLIAIILVAVALPLQDIASAASILFIVLFMQLNYAYVQLRRQKPEARWQYVVPFEPVLPLFAVFLYGLLGIALFHVSTTALYFLLIWILIGLVNYLGYAKRIRREDHARDVVYEHSTRFHPKSEYRVVLPVGDERNWQAFADIASAMTKEEGGDLIALKIHEIHAGDHVDDAFQSSREKRVLEEIEENMSRKRQNVDTRIVAAHSIPDAILETVASENADLVILNWDGGVDTKGFIFGRKIDVVLHRAKCDLLTVKLGTTPKMEQVFIPVAVDGNPNLRFTGKVATALCHTYGSKVTVAMVVPEDVRGKSDAYYRKVLEERVRELKIKDQNVTSQLVYSDYLASGILKAASGSDVVLLPAARGGITQVIGIGSVPEQVAKNCRRKTVMMAKGYRGITQPFSDYIAQWF